MIASQVNNNNNNFIQPTQHVDQVLDKSTPKEISTQEANGIVEANEAEQNQKFLNYLKDFQDTNSTKSIPLDFQIKLLNHFKNCEKESIASIEQAKKNMSEGHPVLIPVHILESTLASYRKSIDTLQASISTLKTTSRTAMTAGKLLGMAIGVTLCATIIFPGIESIASCSYNNLSSLTNIPRCIKDNFSPTLDHWKEAISFSILSEIIKYL